MPVEVILFDLDDTLVIEQASADAAFLATSDHANKKYGCDPKQLSKVVRDNARKLWYGAPTIDYCLNVGISSWEGLWARFSGEDSNLQYLNKWAPEYRRQSWLNALSEFGIDDVEFAEQLGETFARERRGRHHLFPDTRESLEQLRNNYRLGIITNGAPDLQREKIDGSNIGGFFENVIISGEVGIGKPDIRLFKLALERFTDDSMVAVLVGDSLEKDIQGAQNVGIRAIWINRSGIKKEDQKLTPDIQIKSLTELPSVLSSLHFKQ